MLSFILAILLIPGLTLSSAVFDKIPDDLATHLGTYTLTTLPTIRAVRLTSRILFFRFSGGTNETWQYRPAWRLKYPDSRSSLLIPDHLDLERDSELIERVQRVNPILIDTINCVLLRAPFDDRVQWGGGQVSMLFARAIECRQAFGMSVSGIIRLHTASNVLPDDEIGGRMEALMRAASESEIFTAILHEQVNVHTIRQALVYITLNEHNSYGYLRLTLADFMEHLQALLDVKEPFDEMPVEMIPELFQVLLRAADRSTLHRLFKLYCSAKAVLGDDENAVQDDYLEESYINCTQLAGQCGFCDLMETTSWHLVCPTAPLAIARLSRKYYHDASFPNPLMALVPEGIMAAAVLLTRTWAPGQAANLDFIINDLPQAAVKDMLEYILLIVKTEVWDGKEMVEEVRRAGMRQWLGHWWQRGMEVDPVLCAKIVAVLPIDEPCIAYIAESLGRAKKE